MIQQIMKRKVFVGLLAVLVLAAAFGRMTAATADEYRFVTLEKGAKENEIKVGLLLSAQENVEQTGTFQVQFDAAADISGSVEDIAFKFDSGIRSNPAVTVKEYRYNRENGTFTLYVSGTDDDILKRGTPLSLGTITVTADCDVTFTVAEAGCKVVDEYLAVQPVTVLGNLDEYIVRKQQEPETPEESTPEESTPEETPEESTPEETPEESTPEETPEESKPEETPEESNPEETPAESKPSDNKPSGNSGGGSSGRKEHSSSYGSQKDPAETKGTWILKDGAWSFVKEGGANARNEWIKVAGEWYWMEADGKMAVGWIQQNNVWYFLSQSGAMKTGWVQDKENWYYLGESGAMKTGWIFVSGNWYYLDETGRMLADTVTPDGARVDKNGAKIN